MLVSTGAEAYRTRTVAEYELSPDSLQDELERVLVVAAMRWRVPRATFTVIEGERQFFPARLGMEQRQTHRAASLCALAVESGELVMAADTRLDPRLWNHPAVTGPPFIRFYAGVPLRIAPEAAPLGALCVLDTRPKPDIDIADVRVLTDLSQLVVEALAMRRERLGRRRAAEALFRPN